MFPLENHFSEHVSGAGPLGKWTHSKAKVCVPFSFAAGHPGAELDFKLARSVEPVAVKQTSSTLPFNTRSTLWLDGLNARKLQHRCSSPPVTLLSKLASCYCTLGSPFTVTVTKAENFPVCHTSFLSVTRRHSSVSAGKVLARQNPYHHGKILAAVKIKIKISNRPTH